MWTQKDQIQAYQFLRRRLVSALVAADANHPVSPSKRLVLGTALGLAGALLVAAVFGIIGLLTPMRAQQWQQGGQVIMEKETGARFILDEDGVLHPVFNYASARLLAGGDGDKTATIPAKKLAGVPRGPAVGIVGAPDSLPQKNRLLADPWIRCTRRPPDRPTEDDPVTSVHLGQDLAGAEVPPGHALLARLGSGDLFLITAGQRHRVAGDKAVVALGYAAVEPIPVTAAWLNTIASGRDLRTIDIPDSGAPGPVVGGITFRVGQIIVSGAEEFYLVRRDSLAVITETEANLVLGSPAAAAAYPAATPRPLRVAAADIAGVPRAPAGQQGYPARRPKPVQVPRTATVCTSGDRIAVGASLQATGSARPTLVGAAAEVYLPGGSGALVAEQPVRGASSGAVYLITDTGRKYPIVPGEAIKALGYGDTTVAPVPAAVLALFPTGVTLDPAKAQGIGALGG